MKKSHLLLVIPAIIAWFALNGFGFVFKAAVPLSCALIVGFIYQARYGHLKSIWFVFGALVFSAAGDWFLSFKGDSFLRFAAGIALYFVAHAGYLAFALANGKLHIKFTLVVLVGYLFLYFMVLVSVISEPVLQVAVLFYLLISCVSLGAAAGLELKAMVKWSYFAAITLILISDTIIAFHEFASNSNLSFLILPTYYAAHLLITFGLISKK